MSVPTSLTAGPTVVALRADVTLVDTPDGLELRPAAGPALRSRPAAGVRAALAALATGPRSPAELAAVAVEAQDEAVLLRLYPVLDRLDAAGLLTHAVHLDGSAVATLVPLGGYPVPRRTRPDQRTALTLSRLATVHAVDGALHARTPRARLDVRLDPRGAALLPALAAGASPPELARAAGLPAGSTDDVLGLLVAAGVAVDPVQHAAETTDPVLAPWSACDLWTHVTSRSNRSSDGYGPTAPYADRFAPLPGVPVPGPGRIDPLPFPPAREDPPLHRVLAARRSRRVHDEAAPITREQLAELLHRTLRTVDVRPAGDGPPAGGSSPFRAGGDHEILTRPYPSGGGLHELEVYPLVTRCPGLEPGLWHYRGAEHALQRVAEPSRPLQSLVSAARAGGGFPHDPQVLLVVTARFGRVFRQYRGMAYTLVLRDVGVLYHALYLAAAAMDLAACGLGGGDADDFAAASGLDPLAEGSVGEFAIGSLSRNGGDGPAAKSVTGRD